MELTSPPGWYASWAYSVPLVVLTLVIHIFGLEFVNERVMLALSSSTTNRRFTSKFAVAMSLSALAATVLLGIEAFLWAVAYQYLGALPDHWTAMLYSLSMLTTSAHTHIFLGDHWKLMGAIEALNGILLFGLTTAFLFAMIQRVWTLQGR